MSMTSYKISISDKIISTNKSLCRKCSCRLGSLKDKFEKSLSGIKGLPQVKKRSVLCIYSYRTKLIDHDNAYVTVKALVDALKRCKVIIDDDPNHIEGPYFFQFEVPKNRERTEITLKELA